MRILHSSDWHLGKTLDSFSRIDEQKKFLDFFVDKSAELQPDIIILAGDIFDTSNPSAISEKMFYDTLTNLSAYTKSLIVIIPGNHDSSKRLSSANMLARTHGVIIYETGNDNIDLGVYKDAEVLSCNEGVIKLSINNNIVNIMALPYLSEAGLNESIQDLFESEEKNAKSFQKKFKELIEKKEKFFKKEEYNIVVAHLFTTKASIREEETGYSLGGAYIVDACVFPSLADYVALGHIHKMQCVSGVDKRAYYSGSPIHYNKSEVNIEKKCFLLVDINKNKELKVKAIDIPIYKKIDIWELNSIEEAIEMSKKKSDEDSFVYINIYTDRLITNDEIRQIKSNKEDIIEIRPIMNILKTTSKEENMLEKNDTDKFIEFYKEKYGISPQDSILKRYIDIINYSDNDIEED